MLYILQCMEPGSWEWKNIHSSFLWMEIYKLRTEYTRDNPQNEYRIVKRKESSMPEETIRILNFDKCSCGKSGIHYLEEHDKIIQNTYRVQTRDIVSAPGMECTCGVIGVHYLLQHDHRLETRFIEQRRVVPPVTLETQGPDPSMAIALRAAAVYCTQENQTANGVIEVAMIFAEWLRGNHGMAESGCVG